MKLKAVKNMPLVVASAVMLGICILRVANLDFFERIERMTFDMRARTAARMAPAATTNLGFVFINEKSVRRVFDGSLGYSFGLLWPRQVYGRLVEELRAQGAKAVGLDVVFGELRPDHAPVLMADGNRSESDDFFASAMQRAGNVVLAITPELRPPPLFMTNALAAGDILVEKDADGILRRAQAFRLYRDWHPVFRQMENDSSFGVDLRKARVEPHQIILPRQGLEEIKIPLDQEGNFDLADFVGNKVPAGIPAKARPFSEQRIWNMGIVLGAQELGLRLDQAEIDLRQHQIKLSSPNGLNRVIPVDERGFFFIDWSLTEEDPRLTLQPIHELLEQYNRRIASSQTNELSSRWKGKLAVVGSGAVVGNDLTDRGATSLSSEALMVSEHWNVANSLILGRFIRRTSLWWDMALILGLGLVSGAGTMRLRAMPAFALVLVAAAAYSAIAFYVYQRARFWLPLVLPIGGALLTNYVCLVTWRVVFEEAERRRIKSVFSTIVSPKIVNELLKSQTLSLAGARREITVLFADVRGFTQLADASQERVADFVKQNNISDAAAEEFFDRQAHETMATVNLYLGLVTDIVIKHDGTVDKLIGDCVMAFWGAPTLNPRHASVCVRAAIDAQRAIHELNRKRQDENARREVDNQRLAAVGATPLPLLPILALGTGINTGIVTVGLMGAESKTVIRQGSYTVFGHDVNLASRLESASGHGRIYIGEKTYQHLLRYDPPLAQTCEELPGQKLKGISAAIRAYEVPWRTPGTIGGSEDEQRSVNTMLLTASQDSRPDSKES